MSDDNFVLVSPITNEPLVRRDDGFYEAPNDKQLYIYDGEMLTALLSPNGNPMFPKDGFFFSEVEGVYYDFTGDDLVALVSPIDGSPLVPDGKGGFDSATDDLVYELHYGVVVPLISPDGMPIVSNGDGTYYCETDGKMYEITEKGRVNSVTEEELERRREMEAEYYRREEETPINYEDDKEENAAELENDNLYGYDEEAANIILNSYVLGELTRESIEEAFDSLGLPFTEDLFAKLEKAKEDFSEFIGDFDIGTVSRNEEKSEAEKINDEFNQYNTPAFMDPIKAYKLNREYRELTGSDNKRFLEETPAVIATINRDKKTLVNNGLFDSRYFDALNNIAEYVKLKNGLKYDRPEKASAIK